MKRKNASLLGNVLMGLGLVVMVVGVGYSILNQLPQLNLPQFFAHGAILSIFVGAVLWLAGARIGGHEQVSDRYWWVRHYDKRCRRNQHRHSYPYHDFPHRPLTADALFCVSLYLFLFFPPYYAPIPSWPSCCYGCQQK